MPFFRRARAAAVVVALTTTGCTIQTPVADATAPARFLLPPAPPRIDAADPAEAADAGRAAAVAIAARRERGRAVKNLNIDEIPLFNSSPVGRAYSVAPAARALARGAPAAKCPALAFDAGARDLATAAEAALRGCLAKLERRNAPEDCACRLIAANAALLAPRDDFAFARRAAARVLTPGAARARLLTAEIVGGGPESSDLAISAPTGPVAVATLEETGGARWRWLGGRDDAALSGERRRFGFRRGRYAERLTLRGAGGERMSVLIAVRPDDAIPPPDE